MTVARVRALIPDKAIYDRASATGDGVTTTFELPHAPVVSGSVAATLDGVSTSAYTADLALGLVTFTAAPADGAAIVITYQHTMLSDEDLETFLTLEGSDVRLATAQALDTIGSNQTLVLKVIRNLDLQTDGAAVSRELRQRAKTLRDQAEQYAGFDIAELAVNDFALRERDEKEWLRHGA